MNKQSQQPSDDELDRLLASRVRRTTPEFEMRWRALRHGFVHARAPRQWAWPRWLLWPGVAAGALALLVFTLDVRNDPAAASQTALAGFEQLLALDAALAPAQPLLEAETRDAVLHLPVSRQVP